MKSIVLATLLILGLSQFPFSNAARNPDLEFTDKEKVALEKVKLEKKNEVKKGTKIYGKS